MRPADQRGKGEDARRGRSGPVAREEVDGRPQGWGRGGGDPGGACVCRVSWASRFSEGDGPTFPGKSFPAEHEANEAIDGAVGFNGVAQGLLRIELIGIAATFALSGEESGGDEFGYDFLDASFGDAHMDGDLPQEHFRLLGEAEQDMGMVGEEGPLCWGQRGSGLGQRLHVDLFRNQDTRMVVRVFAFWHCSPKWVWEQAQTPPAPLWKSCPPLPPVC